MIGCPKPTHKLNSGIIQVACYTLAATCGWVFSSARICHTARSALAHCLDLLVWTSAGPRPLSTVWRFC